MLEIGFISLVGWCFWKFIPALFIAFALWSLGISFTLFIIAAILEAID